MLYERFAFQKLVRDKVVAQTEAEGCRPTWRPLPTAELIEALLSKITEEAAEVRTALGNKTELTKELADVMEVLLALGATQGIAAADIEAARQNKLQHKGGFTQHTYVEFMDIPTDHYEIQDFLADPIKYGHRGQVE